MLKKQLVMIVFTLAAITNYAQVKISGSVYDEYLEPFYNARISSGENIASSDEEGNFSIVLSSSTLPQTIVVSAFGFRSEEVTITSFDKKVNVVLKENLLLDQVVISASRVPERIIESPVTIERMGLSDIRKNTSNSFYDGLANLKGVNSREGSYGFKSINTRGFADFANTRFVQMVDGMDTAAQALSYSTGNFSGVSELDIQSVEILPGASSALYGANAYNGIMLLNTKNPFNHTGISTMIKSGYTSQETGGNNPFYDVAVRMGYKFNEAFAAKVNFSYFETEEWHANDLRNKEIDTNELIEGTVNSTPNYNGVNTYGDESYIDLILLDENIPWGTLLRKTGYTEAELIKNDFTSRNARFSGALYYRPFKNESLEIQFTSRLSLRDNLFQGISRLAQRGYYIGQHKLEVKGNNFYVRGYYTENDSGNSYDLTRTGGVLNNAANSFDYAIDFYDQRYNQGKSIEEARAFADRNRLVPNTSAFNTEFDRITKTLISDGGSKIYEKSSYTHLDGNYNFKSLLNNWADIQIGASYRNYNPESKGTLFNDKEEAVNIEEYGAYTQFQKKLFEERLKLTASIRYDKSDNFEGNYSPRFALNYALGEEKNHVLRASYQTGFRNPSIQEQYMFFSSQIKTNVGAVADNLSRISYPDSYYIRWDEQLGGYVFDTREVKGEELLNNSLLTRSVYFDTDTYTGDTYIETQYNELVPEVVKTFEVGYRSMFRLNNETNIDIDMNAFYSKHDNFVFYQDVTVPNGGEVYPYGNRQATAEELELPENRFSYVEDGVIVMNTAAYYAFSTGLVRDFTITTNANSQVESYGFGFGMHTKLFSNFDFGLNYNFIDFKYEDKDYGLFEPNFNTPKHTVKAQLGNENLFNNFGFGVSARWQDKYRWVSNFVKGDIPERTVIDAQLNYRIPSIKSRIKVGGTNLFGKEYYVAPGSGQIGQLYYVSWIINN
ncbi:TonB-dependent receptor plug domain-containing protein [Tenacibaculum tangerinum]|uniref:TonB-dependent receptor plug domain-containing protein n=1 Tax=Tenacibaculum tangerinum TaxID=3038772 RepID=A0ABY8L4R9_9FLAO|nr:TonB-dependent receptor [Tenacibaculum tangerinum]WGH74900.1 TonB-dependent receptor plug domain-containing protein [Tenacibaculum tangerinum]